MRIAFMGTPDFALPSLSALIEQGHMLCVFTQPDRPVGRKAVLTAPPVKQLALKNGVPVQQFEKIKSDEGVAALEAFRPELCVTAAFGQFLSRRDLAVPKYGTFNVHASLLPRYRGASPIQSAILSGDTETGVTIMLTDIGMDSGEILLQERTAIDPNENSAELSARLSVLGADALLQAISQLQAGTLTRCPQDASAATRCRILSKEDGRIDLTASCRALHDHIRGMAPWPVAFALWRGETIKLWDSRLSELLPSDNETIGSLRTIDGKLLLRCTDGYLELTSLQTAGGKRMDAQTFQRGHAMDGEVLQ